MHPIVNPIITITESGTGSASALTEGDNHIESIDNDFNDGQFFPTAEASPGFMLFLDEGDGILTGPVYDEDRGHPPPRARWSLRRHSLSPRAALAPSGDILDHLDVVS